MALVKEALLACFVGFKKNPTESWAQAVCLSPCFSKRLMLSRRHQGKDAVLVMEVIPWLSNCPGDVFCQLCIIDKQRLITEDTGTPC